MGVKVKWLGFNEICPPTLSLATFIGALFHFVKQPGMEHEEFLEKQSTPNAFICEPVIHTSIWGEIQDLHPKTLACSFAMTGNSKHMQRDFADRVLEFF